MQLRQPTTTFRQNDVLQRQLANTLDRITSNNNNLRLLLDKLRLPTTTSDDFRQKKTSDSDM